MGWIDVENENEINLRARQVLNDATFAAIRWSYGPIEQGAESRVFYAGAISLLRAVGHVLKNVDSKAFPNIACEVEARFDRWKTGEGFDVIFPEFIEKERNLVLKEYASEWNASNEVEMRFRPLDIADGLSEESSRLQKALNERVEKVSMKAILFPDGPLAGYSFDELLVSAVNWWSKELKEIEGLIGDKDAE